MMMLMLIDQPPATALPATKWLIKRYTGARAGAILNIGLDPQTDT